MTNQIQDLLLSRWDETVPEQVQNHAIEALENGKVLHAPALKFELLPNETPFLSSQWSDGKAKNISLQPKNGQVLFKGAQGDADELAQLRAMLERYASSAEALAKQLFPHYASHLVRANTSYRPFAITERHSSYRKDDSRLHTDAFPSNPTCGTRLFRVFTNVNHLGIDRVWRVGEPFEDMAKAFLPKTKGMFPGQSKIMHALKLTKRPRTEYDHRMLQLHDQVKADMNYQQHAPQQTVHFKPGTTWMVFSDQVLHAAMSGQFMFEQTFYLPSDHVLTPKTSPLHVLEKLLHKKLI